MTPRQYPRPASYLGKRIAIVCGLGGVFFCGCVLLALSMGPSAVNLGDLVLLFTGRVAKHESAATILWQIRLPRVLLAAVTGATLSLGGMVFQALLRNPLAEPYILGISGGSALGAIFGILLGVSFFPGITVLSFTGSLLTLAMIYLLSGRQIASTRDSLLLAGVMINAFCSAAIMFLISISRSTQMQQIIYWLMGDLSLATGSRLGVLLFCLPPFAVILALCRPLNILLAGHEAARAMGVDVKKVTLLLLVATSLMVSIVVSQSGLIGFVGLLIPHLLRLTIGPDHRLLAPGCILAGGGYLVVCDLLARTLPGHGEMPVGIITAIIGAPLFVFLLLRSRQ